MRLNKKRWTFLLVITLLAAMQTACGFDSITGSDDGDSDSEAAGNNVP